MPLIHTITNQIFGWFTRVNGYHDDGEGFGHIDLGGINLMRRYHVVERLVDVLNDTYYIRVTGSFDTHAECIEEANFRLDYCKNYAPGCWSEYEIWDFQVYRYRYYYGDDFYQGNELPWCMCAIGTLGDGCKIEYFDDAEEAAEFASQLVRCGYVFYDARVSSAEISYLDNLTEEWFPKRLSVRLPLFLQFFSKS